MGRLIPAPIVGQSAASGAQIVNGSLRFDSNGGASAATSQRLARTFGSAGDTQKMTMSVWVKRTSLSTSNTNSGTKTIFGAATGTDRDQIRFEHNSSGRGNQLSIALLNDAATANECFLSTGPRFRDASAWYHVVWAIDTTQATEANRVKLYVNGTQITDFSGNNTQPGQNFTINHFNNSVAHEIGRDPSGSNQAFDGYMSNFYWIDGQQLDASNFGFTDPLTNTWRPKKYTGTFGTNGFWLPLDGDAPIGKDKSGNGNDFTPSVFGGTNSIEKATGALPILNTANGGNVATVGVRTDTAPGNGPVGVSTHLVLALPLVGISSDVSNQINSGSTTKAITANGNAAGSTAQSNFYGASYVFDGTGDYLSTPDSTDFAFGSGDFTVEAWFRATAVPGSGGDTIVSQSGSNTDNRGWQLTIRDTANSVTNPLKLLYSTNGTAWANSSGSNGTSTSTIVTGRWYHGAVSRSGNTWYLFVNGKLENSWTDSNSIFNTTAALEIGSTSALSEAFAGNIQDVRVYNGVAKYTSDFIPASTDPDILPDTPSGVAGGSALTSIPDSATEGAVAFDNDGSGYLRIDRDTNTDFEFGTGSFTIEAWVYMRETGDNIMSTTDNGNYTTGGWLFESNNEFRIAQNGGTYEVWGTFNYPFGRWFHVAVTRDGSTYYGFIDGVQQWTGSSSFNNTFGSTNDLAIGATRGGASGLGSYSAFLNGAVSNVRIVKGTAVYTSNFTPPTTPLTNITNTVLLCCQSTTSATASAVNPGNLEVNGTLSATKFSPFLLSSNINTVRGQESGWATFNPLQTTAVSSSDTSLTNGNLDISFTTSANNYSSYLTQSINSGKFYLEVTINSSTTTSSVVGFVGDNNLEAKRSATASAVPGLQGTYGKGVDGTGALYDGSGTNEGSYMSSWSQGDVIMVAIDADNDRFYLGKNGILQTTAITFPAGTTKPYHFGVGDASASVAASFSLNTGQKPFKYAPPDGFQPLCLANLPRPTSPAAVRPDKYVGIVTYTGNGGTQSIKGLGFQPDFVWCKSNSASNSHGLFDDVRGVQKELNTNGADGEGTGLSGVTSFDSDGFSLGSRANENQSSETFVSWCWKAGGGTGITTSFWKDDVDYGTAEAAGITEGTISLTGASVNTEAGFSIITWTGAGGNSGTVGHGLNEKPQIIIAKSRDSSDNWVVYTDIIDESNDFVKLNSTDAKSDSSHANTTSTTFNPYYSQTTAMFVAYCWHSVPGFSKFGAFEGNNNDDGSYIHLGFKPALVIVKAVDSVETVASIAASSWGMWDSTRMPNNPGGNPLWANNNGTQSIRGNNSTANTGGSDGNELGGFLYVDLLSNGFKCRTGAAEINSAQTHIYMAWAEVPTQNLYGGQANAR